MAELQSFDTEVGTWLLIEELGATLRALVHAGESQAEPGFTLFWPGRFDARNMMRFHRVAGTQVNEHRPFERQKSRILVYDRRSGEPVSVTIGNGISFPEFADADFARFEHVRSMQYAGIRVREESPVLILWTHITEEIEDLPDDATGILMQPRHLPGLRYALAELIAATSAKPMNLFDVASMLDELDHYLRPDTAPIAMAV
ncbi:hypothetical protein Q9Q95_03310 [Sphingomonas sp. DG1-23]|uniref:hypothetical protein n=1 Tax=Sphingomonas sp. DG1-23 TaxID=3068316 RepID=UPI00273EAEDF|nr:hypothetical protein [Sphingomonas sp. DG1-23]MDP5277940.1 hypothetical protein [Sphingomonas sp. DG1-23]